MRRILVVGCGGSGGATLAYMMDQLRSDLAEADVHALPAGWQFVHIDVPTAPDGLPGGLTNVRDQGGAYFGAGPQNGNYAEMDRTVAHRLTLKNGLEHVATWAPRDPQAVDTPISEGAGQYRAIGRMITLSNVVEIDRVLNSALNRLDAQQTITEMTRLDVPGLGRYDEATQPMVIVVSSMAGGAGASMALDVCRILTTDTRVSANLVGVFMLACNVFGKTAAANTPGVGPNSLAMLGEIVATQTGAARRHDKALLEALGLGAGGAEIPFARVFPVGRFSGAQRTEFGDGTAEAVYRGLGRGLAALVMSETATEQFIAYDLANRESPTGDTRLLGWGSEPSSMAWGSYGYACLSMGRDRYREYAAQRIARTAVDRLLGGHLQRASSSRRSSRSAHCWKPVAGAVHTASPAAGADRSARARRRGRADVAVRRRVHAGRRADRRPGGGREDHRRADRRGPRRGVRACGSRRCADQLSQRRSILATEVRQRAAEWAYRWHTGLLERTEAMAEAAVATVGLPYAIAFVERLSRHLATAGPAGPALGSYAATDIAAFPRAWRSSSPRSRGGGSRTACSCRTWSASSTRSRSTTTSTPTRHSGGPAVGRHVRRVLAPLVGRAAGGAAPARGRARACRSPTPGSPGWRPTTSTLWPRPHESVPERFAHADNEVLLTDTAAFPEQYDADIRGADSSGRRAHPARRWARSSPR